MSFYENGEAVETVDPDIYFDEIDEEPQRDVSAMAALLSVVFELGQWAGRCPIKQYAAKVVMRQADQCTTRFAAEHGISDSFVRRRIREAKAVIGSAAEPHE